MNKWSGFLPITVALIIAMVGSIFTYSWIKKQTSMRQSAGNTDAVSIAVASHDLPWGTQLKKEDIQMVSFLKDSVTPDYFTDVSKFFKVPHMGSILGEDTTFGTSVAVEPGTIVGAGCKVSSGAKIIRNLPNRSLVA